MHHHPWLFCSDPWRNDNSYLKKWNQRLNSPFWSWPPLFSFESWGVPPWPKETCRHEILKDFGDRLRKKDILPETHSSPLKKGPQKESTHRTKKNWVSGLEQIVFREGKPHRIHVIYLHVHQNQGHGGHLRPQNPVTCDHKQKNRSWVTCDHKVRSLTTTKRHIRWQGQQNLHSARGHLWPQFAVTCDQKLGSLGLIRITCTHAQGGWGGWGGGMITYLALAHILAEYITCTHARGGYRAGGVGGMIPFRD